MFERDYRGRFQSKKQRLLMINVLLMYASNFLTLEQREKLKKAKQELMSK